MKSLPAARWVPQATFLLVVIGGATLRNLGLAAGWIPELRALCPFGATGAIASLFGPVSAIEWSRLLVPGGVVLTALILGPVFCGRICPLGSVQEWIGRLGRRFLGSRFNRPVPGDRGLSHLRYAVLAMIAATGLGFLTLETDLLNPSLALVHAWTSAVPITAVALLALVLVASFFVERPWCRWLCPYGVLLGAIARISPWTIRRNASTCIDCGRCNRTCPLAIKVSTTAAVRDSRCNRCERCIAACPVSGALVLRHGAPHREASSTRRRRYSAGISAAALLLFSTPLLLTWVVDTTAAREAGTGTPPIVERSIDAETITPMMTLQGLAEKAGVSQANLLEHLGLPADLDPGLMLIDIEDEPGLEHVTVGHIRTVLAEKGE